MAQLFDDEEFPDEYDVKVVSMDEDIQAKEISPKEAKRRERKAQKKEKRRQKKERKKDKRLYRKIGKHYSTWPKIVFWPLYVLAVLWHCVFRVLKYTVLIGLVAALTLTFLVGRKVYPVMTQWKQEADAIAETSTLADFAIKESTRIYSSDKKQLAVLRETADQEYIEYDDLPSYVVDAFVAVEDRSFWSNPGIDIKGIIRVGVDFIKTKGSTAHGASTITQQLARDIYLSQDKTITRKGKEIFLALDLSKMYTKKQIMEFYVNDICYGNNVYGIGGAARAYFNKSLDNLSLSQIAYLCALPNRPSYYDPYKNPENAIERRNKILGDMLEMRSISQAEYEQAVAEEIVIEKPDYKSLTYNATYAIDCAIRWKMKEDGFKFKYSWKSMNSYNKYMASYREAYETARHELNTGGYKIYTSLNKSVTKKAQTALDEALSFSKARDPETGIYSMQGAITVVDNNSRKVIAVVGGRTQKNKNTGDVFNRAYQAYRQPGSSFKPIAVYTPALMKEYTPETTLYDIDTERAKEKGADPQTMYGPAMSLRRAVENSKNGAAWRVFDDIGPQYGLSFVQDMHFSKIVPDDYNDSAALGGLTFGVTTVEMAEAYSTLANHGRHVDATCITSIKDSAGKEVYKESKARGVYTEEKADTMLDILKGVITNGTASGLNWYDNTQTDAFGKTGTTNDHKDGWFCGATPYYSIAVWVGRDTPKTVPDLSGNTYPATIWKNAMLSLISEKNIAHFEANQ